MKPKIKILKGEEMLNYFRKDFASVSEAVSLLTNGKAPKWAIVIWYILILPIGLALLPVVKMIQWIQIKELNKTIKELNKVLKNELEKTGTREI